MAPRFTPLHELFQTKLPHRCVIRQQRRRCAAKPDTVYQPVDEAADSAVRFVRCYGVTPALRCSVSSSCLRAVSTTISSRRSHAYGIADSPLACLIAGTSALDHGTSLRSSALMASTLCRLRVAVGRFLVPFALPPTPRSCLRETRGGRAGLVELSQFFSTSTFTAGSPSVAHRLGSHSSVQLLPNGTQTILCWRLFVA